MELLIAALMALGVITGDDAKKLAEDEKAVYEFIDENQVDKEKLDEQMGIIELEETDF